MKYRLALNWNSEKNKQTNFEQIMIIRWNLELKKKNLIFIPSM